MPDPQPLETQSARQLLRRVENARFVEPELFRQLLVSTRRLLRADEPRARALGLVDAGTGQRFLVEEEKLFSEAR